LISENGHTKYSTKYPILVKDATVGVLCTLHSRDAQPVKVTCCNTKIKKIRKKQSTINKKNRRKGKNEHHQIGRLITENNNNNLILKVLTIHK
jgi:hypothetical protein